MANSGCKTPVRTQDEMASRGARGQARVKVQIETRLTEGQS